MARAGFRDERLDAVPNQLGQVMVIRILGMGDEPAAMSQLSSDMRCIAEAIKAHHRRSILRGEFFQRAAGRVFVLAKELSSTPGCARPCR